MEGSRRHSRPSSLFCRLILTIPLSPSTAVVSASDSRFFRAIRQEALSYPPIWLMRQAGRYLPEYNATRRKAGSFLNLMRTPELACEVTLQPIDRYAFDAAIIFSDILTVPDALGANLQFVEGEGPVLRQTVRTEQDLAQLRSFDPNALRYVYDALRLTRQALAGRAPLIGFSGSPWTLACYMVDGQGGGEFLHTRRMLYAQPDLLEALLQRLSLAVIDYLKAQIEAGAQAVMLFDSWAGLLPPALFEKFSLRFLQQIVQGLRTDPATAEVPVLVFCRGAGVSLSATAAIGANVVGVDWTQSLAQAFEQVAGRCAVQGNLDPAALLGTPAQVRFAVQELLASVATRGATDAASKGHIFNLGHGISKFTPIESVEILIETVRASNL